MATREIPIEPENTSRSCQDSQMSLMIQMTIPKMKV